MFLDGKLQGEIPGHFSFMDYQWFTTLIKLLSSVVKFCSSSLSVLVDATNESQQPECPIPTIPIREQCISIVYLQTYFSFFFHHRNELFSNKNSYTTFYMSSLNRWYKIIASIVIISRSAQLACQSASQQCFSLTPNQHQPPASSTFLSQQISTNYQPQPVEQTIIC